MNQAASLCLQAASQSGSSGGGSGVGVSLSSNSSSDLQVQPPGGHKGSEVDDSDVSPPRVQLLHLSSDEGKLLGRPRTFELGHAAFAAI